MIRIANKALRAMSENDLELVLSWRNDPQVRKNMYSNHIISLTEHEEWFQRESENEMSRLLIFERDEVPKGFVSFTKIDRRNKHAYWAFYSGSLSERGLGLSMEVLALKYAFEVLEIQKLCCEVLSFNDAVVNFHIKFGFEQEGVRKRHYVRDEQYYDIHQLAIFDNTWLKNKERLEDKLAEIS